MSERKYSFIDFLIFLLFKATTIAYGNSKAGVKSELKLQAYDTAMAALDPELHP